MFDGRESTSPAMRTLPLVVTLSLVHLLGIPVIAQTDGLYEAVHYQAVARDVAGQPISGQTIGLQLELTAGPGVVYRETMSVTTNDQGLFTAPIGTGVPDGHPPLVEYDWYHPSQEMKLFVYADFSGGTNYQLIGEEPIRAVPSAQTARQATVLLDSSVVVMHAPDRVVVDSTFRLGVGTSTPDTTLHVVGKLKYQDGNEADRRALISDIEGKATWRSAGPSITVGLDGSLAVLPLGIWVDDLTMQLPLIVEQDRVALISYQICTDVANSAPFYSRLALDGSPLIGSNAAQLSGTTITLGASGIWTIPAGSHTVSVQYRTTANAIFSDLEHESHQLSIKVLDY
mgnify:CR=1 FL=1